MSDEREPVTINTNLRVGETVECRNAHGELVRLVCVNGAPRWGRDMVVVWVCRPEKFDQDDPEAHAVPWPAEDVYRIEGTD